MWPSSIMLEEVMLWIYNFQAVSEVVPWSTLLSDLIVNFNTIILSRLNTNDATCPIIIAASICWTPRCYLKFTYWPRKVDFDSFRITFIDFKNADCLYPRLRRKRRSIPEKYACFCGKWTWFICDWLTGLWLENTASNNYIYFHVSNVFALDFYCDLSCFCFLKTIAPLLSGQIVLKLPRIICLYLENNFLSLGCHFFHLKILLNFFYCYQASIHHPCFSPSPSLLRFISSQCCTLLYYI